MKNRSQRSPTPVSLLHTIDSNPDPTLNNPFHWHTGGGIEGCHSSFIVVL